MTLLKKIKQHNTYCQLIKKGDRLVLGVSGGPDSVALLMIMADFQKKENLNLIVAHVNYGLRGQDSERDEKLVRELSQKLGLKVLVKKYYAKKRAGNPEELMRDFRYSFFEEIRKKYRFDKVVVAHTLDDRVETFLMNLIRGSGIRGLISLKEKRDRIIRPLLKVKKSEIVTWLKKKNIKFRIDKSNQDNSFYRNSIRNELIPLLEKKYNPLVKNKIFNLAQQLEEITNLVENKLKYVYNNVVIVQKEKELVLDGNKLNQMSDFWQGECFRRVIKSLGEDLSDITQANAVEFSKIIKSAKGKRQKMKLGAIELEKVGMRLIFKVK